MNFSEIPYARPNTDAFCQAAERTIAAIESAGSAQEQLDAFAAYNKLYGNVSTMKALVHVRSETDTEDPFYICERNFFNKANPVLDQADLRVVQALMRSRFRPELEQTLGSTLFANYEIAARAAAPEIVELMQEENRLTRAYQSLAASATADFQGKTLPLQKLGFYKQSPDRAVRRAAYQAEGEFYDAHREEYDQIYDDLVKNRTAQAKRLGYENYLPLGYDRMGRNCYGQEKLAAFREQIVREIVPLVAEIKAAQARRLGVDKLKFHDDTILFPGGNALPKGTPEEIIEAGRRAYTDFSPETAEYAKVLFGNEMIDVLPRKGKAPGGYCVEIYDEKSTFIFANFNGTSADTDVLVHEGGHGFGFYRSMIQKGRPPQLLVPTADGRETHAMTMEFLLSDYYPLFYGENAQQYELEHCETSFTHIPYMCQVDEFQHIIYEQPGLTPEERNRTWLELEKKYRPWNDFDALPFYGRGAGWQRQLHIYQHPLFYIDYSLAQIVAFQFWFLWQTDKQEAWRRYLSFLDKGGTENFEELVSGAGLKLPYEPGCLKDIGQAVMEWLRAHAPEDDNNKTV